MNAGRVRIILLVGASLPPARPWPFPWVIGFVGLVVPHLVRLVQGAEHRPLLITSGLAGDLLLLCRTYWPAPFCRGAELPVCGGHRPGGRAVFLSSAAAQVPHGVVLIRVG
jgi:iron complex transport system permease protein